MFKRNFFAVVLMTVLFGFVACNTTGKCKSCETQGKTDEVTRQVFTDEKGKTLELLFDNAHDTVTALLGEEKAVLKRQKTASGFCYKNENYELLGKGNDVQLIKNGKVIFEHEDDIVFIEAKNNKGETLNMTFNNTQGTVKAYLNGGKQIDLVEQKPASGIWYKNDSYELRGKGDHYTLTKNGKVVFEN